jgi:hypothetical protein
MHDEAAIYRGIRFSWRSLGNGHWRWEIHAPVASVRGFETASGEVAGRMGDAVTAAKKEIDRQSDRKSKRPNGP